MPIGYDSYGLYLAVPIILHYAISFLRKCSISIYIVIGGDLLDLNDVMQMKSTCPARKALKDVLMYRSYQEPLIAIEKVRIVDIKNSYTYYSKIRIAHLSTVYV